jgi:hypothetical protein
MKTIITHTIDFEGVSMEWDAEYVRGSDEPIQDLDLVFIWMHEKDETGIYRAYDLIKNISHEAKLIIEKNILSIPGMEKRLCDDMAEMGHDFFLEPDYDPKDDL